jgi:hypothetical protein|tara:strand:+ start:35 stop:208 length:174 start_codon:yes stop_codon:yes gene_type:complete
MKQDIRFFLYNLDGDDDELITECTENEFLESLGKISYKRHTVFANGVDQVCLTKIIG